MRNIFQSEQIAHHPDNHARVMRFVTPHGSVQTPAFMPVGTRAFVNHADPEDLLAAGSQIILGGNTYHMLVAPGLEVIEALGGMHRMMHWSLPMLTDSGGFQVFSLSKNRNICRIDDAGATFKHPDTGQVIRLDAQASIQAQKVIGADIIMAFDQCTPEEAGREAALIAMERTERWLMASREAHAKQPNSVYGHRQALFGIIQGGRHPDLREKCTRFVLAAELDGIAIGGEVIGFDMAKTMQIIDWVRPMLPNDKVRYTMGVGLHPQDLIDVVAQGVDIFDCVAPTRNARHGALYHGHAVPEGNWVRFDELGEPRGRLSIRKAIYAKDDRPILAGCACYTCQHYSRGYLHHLFKIHSALYRQLASIHNIHVMQAVCEKMRESVMSNFSVG